MKKLSFLLLLFPLFLTGCSLPRGPSDPNCDTTTGNICPLPVQTGQTLSLTGQAQLILAAIKAKDMPTLATLASPQGVRFSPYPYIHTGRDVILSTTEIHNALALSRSYLRGAYDGSGEPMDLGIGQYRDKFVYDAPFITAPEIVLDQVSNRGSIINNIAEVYRGMHWVEYYISGVDPQYEGMDWRSLTLVMDGSGKLVGIVHGQWSP